MSAIVSVIIPTYNHAHYLPHALRSVLAQTFIGWEAVIVDDGSTDATREVAAQFSDPRIHYIYQENQGLSAARNTGIRAAQGRYLAFLDADDEWEPRFLEACHCALTARESVAAVVTWVRFIDEAGNVLPSLASHTIDSERLRGRLLQGGFFPPNAVLVRAEVVQQAGVFDETLTSVEDWDLWLRITGDGGVMQSIPEPLARYRVYPGSMSTNAARMHANRMAVLAKQFGPPGGEPASWTDEKRHAYGFAYRHAALGYLQQGQREKGWGFLMQAVSVHPELLERLDTFFELACGDQSKGYRGQADLLDLEVSAAEMLAGLDDLFAEASPAVAALRRTAYSSAYLALGILSDQANSWSGAREYLLLALRENPKLVVRPGVLRRLLKLIVLNPRLVAAVRSRNRAR